MPEIAIADLDARWQVQALRVRDAAERGDHDFVIAVAERILEEFPGCLEVRRLLREAQRRKARRNTTGFARWLTGMGVQLRTGGLSRKNPRRAIRDAEEALTRDPQNPIAHRLLGQAALELDLPATAVFAFSALREIEPDDRDNLLALGRALIKADRPDDAIRLAEGMLASAPEDAEAEALLKDASVAHSLRQGNWEQEGVARPEETSPPVRAASPERNAVHSEEDLRGRASRLEAEIRDHPADLERYRALAELWQRLGEPVPASEWMEKAIRTPAGAADIEMRRYAGELRTEVLRQRVNSARAEVESRPEDTGAREALEEAETALRVFQRDRLKELVEQYPQDAGLHLEYGRLLLEEGEAEAAALHFQRAVGDPPHRRGALLELGRAFKLRGRYDLALQQFRRALAEFPEMNEHGKALHYEQADTAQLLGRDAEAKVALEAIYTVDVGYRDVAARLDALEGADPPSARG